MTQNSTSKRVAFVSHTTELTGAAMSFYTLLSGLKPEEFQCSAILPGTGPLQDTLKKDGYETCIVPFSGWSKWTAVSKAKAFLKQQQIDLVYLTCAHKYTRMVSKAAHALNIPIVWHVREPPNGHRVQKSIPLMKRFGANVVVVSEEQKGVMAKDIETRKIDNGVNVERFDINISSDETDKKYGLSNSDFVFGIIGTIEKRKNTELFLNAAKVIAEKHPEAKFLIVGSGKDEYVQKMHALIAESEALSKATVFTGSVWNVPEVMTSLNVVVMPSNWEGFPRVVIESMMMGKTVIASDVGDVSYILNDGENGFVVAPRDLETFTEKMLFCIENPEAVEVVSQKAYDKAINNFTQEIHVENMRRIFLESVN